MTLDLNRRNMLTLASSVAVVPFITSHADAQEVEVLPPLITVDRGAHDSPHLSLAYDTIKRHLEFGAFRIVPHNRFFSYIVNYVNPSFIIRPASVWFMQDEWRSRGERRKEMGLELIIMDGVNMSPSRLCKFDEEYVFCASTTDDDEIFRLIEEGRAQPDLRMLGRALNESGFKKIKI